MYYKVYLNDKTVKRLKKQVIFVHILNSGVASTNHDDTPMMICLMFCNEYKILILAPVVDNISNY